MFFQGKIVVVGASNNPQRKSYDVFAKLRKDYGEVIPVHPTDESIQGVQAYASIDTIENIDTLVLIVNPTRALPIVKQALEKGIKKFWFQPGSYDETLMEFLQDKNVETSYGACILLI